MEQNSNETTAPESAKTQTTADSAGAEQAASESAAPRRRSRRATAAVGEAIDPASVPEGAPAVEAAPSAAPEAAETAAPGAEAGADAEAESAPKKRTSRSRKKADATAAADTAAAGTDADTAAEADSADSSSADSNDAEAGEVEASAPATRSRATSGRTRKAKDDAEPAAADASAEGDTESDAGGEDAAAAPADAETTPRKRSSRGRGKKTSETAGETADQSGKTAEESEGAEKSGGDKGAAERNGADKNGQRSNRTRQRERKRRGQGDDFEPEIAEDDVLLPIAGILDVLDNYAFVRTSGYLPGTNDVYVSLGQVKKYGLRKGDSVVGAIRQPREGEGGGRQKYNAIVRVDTVNSRPAEENQVRADFVDFTPIHPSERLSLETEAGDIAQRVIDLFAPVGKGQRGLIVGPHESGKSAALRQIAAAVAANQADAHLMLVLIDERPEEVTELERTVNGEVIASTFDRPAEDHVTIAELAVERAKRLVELGHDVVLLIDSLTSLARSYNALAPAASRVPAGSLDAAALFPVKKLLGAARNIENGGSLTIVATASAQPGSRVDEAVIGELEATANMQLRLNGEAADRRVFPAVELRASSTRREELLTSDAEAKVMDQLRRSLAGQDPVEALEAVLARLAGTSSNVEFLALAQRTQV